jgi:Cu(I)/Ag(I) efflux system periplasmic protein CusF
MNKTLSAAAIALLAGLTACSNQAEPTQNTSASAMENMAMPSEAKSGKATGTVTAIDTATGKITLDHGPVVELQWPAMTMAFGAKPDMLKGIAVGDKVAFEFTMTGATAELTKIAKRP